MVDSKPYVSDRQELQDMITGRKLNFARTSVAWVFSTTMACCCLVLAIGCNTSPYESTVSGTVSLDGAPIGPGIVQFVPVGRSHNPATGTIQVDGDYELRTSKQTGLQAGQYQVTVAVYDQPDVAPGERAAPGSAPLRTPEKYFSLETTDLNFTVEPGSNTIDIALSSK
jgi:hypothetical protein